MSGKRFETRPFNASCEEMFEIDDGDDFNPEFEPKWTVSVCFDSKNEAKAFCKHVDLFLKSSNVVDIENLPK